MTNTVRHRNRITDGKRTQTPIIPTVQDGSIARETIRHRGVNFKFLILKIIKDINYAERQKFNSNVNLVW